MAKFTVAICSYNRCKNLPKLISLLRVQETSISFDILVVDNNSTDNTQNILKQLAQESGPLLRYVLESQQGITYARNRAIRECLTSQFMAFIDDDELPDNQFVSTAYDALSRENADCVAGTIDVDLVKSKRPKWLVKELLGFLGGLDYGKKPFWIKDNMTPVWTGNIAYKMKIFQDDPDLRFDIRFNRIGNAIGGGEDKAMFLKMLEQGYHIRYRPEMRVRHLVEDRCLKRSYFLNLHYLAGKRFGEYSEQTYSRHIFGIPPFMLSNILRSWLRVIYLLFKRKPALRQAMNGAYAFGLMIGYFHRK